MPVVTGRPMYNDPSTDDGERGFSAPMWLRYGCNVSVSAVFLNDFLRHNNIEPLVNAIEDGIAWTNNFQTEYDTIRRSVDARFTLMAQRVTAMYNEINAATQSNQQAWYEAARLYHHRRALTHQLYEARKHVQKIDDDATAIGQELEDLKLLVHDLDFWYSGGHGLRPAEQGYSKMARLTVYFKCIDYKWASAQKARTKLIIDRTVAAMGCEEILQAW